RNLSMPTLTFSSAHDTFIADGDPNVNFGTDPLLVVGRSIDADGETVLRVLLSFDVSLPTNAHIDDATLTLPSFGTPPAYVPTNLFQLQAVSRSWNESEATWNKADASTSWTTPGGDGTTVATLGFAGGGTPLVFTGLAAPITAILASSPGLVSLLVRRTSE